MRPRHLRPMQRGPHFVRNALLVAVAVALVLAGTYVVVTFKPAARSTEMKVLTTFYPVYDYARNIGGDRNHRTPLRPLTPDGPPFQPTPPPRQAARPRTVLSSHAA